MENHQNGGDRSRGRREGNGRLNSLHEALISHQNEVMEDVERGREPSEFLAVLFGVDRLLTSSYAGRSP